MQLLPFFGHDNGSGTKPPDSKRRSKLVSSSAMGRHRLSKLSTLLILSMSASAASHDVLQQHPKQPDVLESKLFKTKTGTQIRKADSDGRNMMTVSLHLFIVMECIMYNDANRKNGWDRR